MNQSEILYKMADLMEARGQAKDAYVIRQLEYRSQDDKEQDSQIGAVCIGGAYALACGTEFGIGHFLELKGPHPVLDLINAAIARQDGLGITDLRYHGFNSEKSQEEVVQFLRDCGCAEAAYEARRDAE